MRKTLFGMVAVAGLAACASGQVQFNETLVNPPGGDQGFEWLELISAAPNFDMTGLTIVIIEGDDNGNGAGPAGTIDQVLSLNGRSTGANRLFLRKDNANNVPLEGFDPLTVVFGQDFTPDIENGANTFLIVEGFTGAVGQDLDTGVNDGILDSTPWTRVVDAIAARDGDVIDGRGFQYATQLGGLDLSDNRGLDDGFTPDSLFRLCGCGYATDALGAPPGSYFNDPNEISVVGSNCLDLNVIFYETTEGRANWRSDECPIVGGCPSDITSCRADQDGDEDVDSDDINVFFNNFEGGDSCGDQDGDDDVDSDDITTFFSRFEAGGC